VREEEEGMLGRGRRVSQGLEAKEEQQHTKHTNRE